MCVFGAPTLHEDDALRAVRAAVDAREDVERLSDELHVRLEVRIGINTGEVVVHPGAERLVTGDAVNVAAGLQHAAARGEIYLGAQTCRLVRAAARVEELEPLTLKRRREAVRAYRLVELVAPAPGGREAPYVGREHELEQLRQAFDRAVRTRAPFLFTVLGPAGVGKSRLASELAASLGDRATVLTGHCLSYGEGITFWPLAEMVRRLTGDDPLTGLTPLLAAEDDAEAIAERIALTIGATERPATLPETSWAVRRLFEALARARPLVAIFEDVHWAEPTLLDLIEYVAELSRDVPMLLLCVARTELLDDRPGWAGGKLNASSILLEPLSETDCATLVDELAPPELDGSARSRIVHASEGNPLFVGQMLALVEEGGDESEVPPTIQSLLAARLDRLPPDERELLECASVEGRQFHLGAVAALLGDGDDVGSRVLGLVRKELVRPDRPSLPGEEAFRFLHILVRDAVYSGVPKIARSELHERFAGWLEQKTSDRDSEYEEIVGYHLEQAAQYGRELGLGDRTAELADAAAARLGSAGRRARARGDSAAASNLISRARALLPADSPSRSELGVDLGVSLIDVGRLERAIEVLQEAEREAGDDERTVTHVRLARRLAEQYHEPEAATDAMLAEGERALPIFERLRDDRGLARAWHLIAISRWTRARAGETAEAAEHVEAHALRAEDGQLRAAGVALRVIALELGPRPVAEGIQVLEGLRTQLSGTRRLEAFVLRGLALLHAMNGEIELARELVAQARVLVQELGLEVSEATLAAPAGVIELLAAEPDAAERELRRGCELLNELGERSYLATLAPLHGRALFELGRLAEADEASRVGETTAAGDDVMSQVVWRGVRARVLAERGAFEEAERVAREAVALAAATDFVDMHGDALGHLAAVLRSAGRRAPAQAAAAEALRLHEQKGNVISAARARAFLAELEPAAAAPIAGS